ncbi:hypothetical protein [Paenibacillus glucanolyticus]|uniref:hypothetical protein n=1 Tax=Paenibacillus glucanolyticus TaxID=59843 RepID=UPI00128D3B77|nr:hypothetical protein [Paenibacillus glucanolyticus]MPY20691.1 hypothetical protein [Paenibacillus glucanolyticus]
MAFEGFREDHRGNWFGGDTRMLYTVNNQGYDFYIINEQEEHIIHVRDENQKEVMFCMVGVELDRERLDWLIKKSGFTYFESVEDYRAYHKKALEDLKR